MFSNNSAVKKRTNHFQTELNECREAMIAFIRVPFSGKRMSNSAALNATNSWPGEKQNSAFSSKPIRLLDSQNITHLWSKK